MSYRKMKQVKVVGKLQICFCSFLVHNSSKEATELARKGSKLEAFTVPLFSSLRLFAAKNILILIANFWPFESNLTLYRAKISNSPTPGHGSSCPRPPTSATAAGELTLRPRRGPMCREAEGPGGSPGGLHFQAGPAELPLPLFSFPLETTKSETRRMRKNVVRSIDYKFVEL